MRYNIPRSCIKMFFITCSWDFWKQHVNACSWSGLCGRINCSHCNSDDCSPRPDQQTTPTPRPKWRGSVATTSHEPRKDAAPASTPPPLCAPDSQAQQSTGHSTWTCCRPRRTFAAVCWGRGAPSSSVCHGRRWPRGTADYCISRPSHCCFCLHCPATTGTCSICGETWISVPTSGCHMITRQTSVVGACWAYLMLQVFR